MSDWGDYVEPNYVAGPDESHFWMGAQVSWHPGREPEGTIEHCSDCGGEGWMAEDGVTWLPGRIADGSQDYCARCRRWGRDARLSEVLIAEFLQRGSIEPIPRETAEDVSGDG